MKNFRTRLRRLLVVRSDDLCAVGRAIVSMICEMEFDEITSERILLD